MEEIILTEAQQEELSYCGKGIVEEQEEGEEDGVQ